MSSASLCRSGVKRPVRSFFRKFFGFYKLGFYQQLQYRFNLISDALIQPIMVAAIEIVLWMAIFKYSKTAAIGAFSKTYYFSYFVWAAFVARISSNWSYEHRMIEEIDSGSINSILVRPTRFFDYYLGQFLGYKLLTVTPAMILPVLICWGFDLPFEISRLPVVLLLSSYYLIFLFSMSFCVACLAFFLARVQAFTGAKNIALWMFTGELYPLDLAPDWLREILIALPFSSGVYIPVGYLTGRFDYHLVLRGFQSVTIGILATWVIGALIWRAGTRVYAGTGA